MAVKPPARTRLASTAQVLTGTAAGIALLYFLRNILVPFVIAFVLVVLVEALVTWIRRVWPRGPRWLVSWIAGLAVIVAAAGGIFALAQGGVQLVQQAPALIDRIEQVVQSIGRALRLRETLHLSALLGQVNLARIAGYILSGVQGVGGTVLLVIIYFGFMVFGRQRISRKLDAMATESRKDDLTRALIERAAADVRTYMWVQTVTGLIITAGAVAVMLFVGLDNVLFWAVVFFLLTFIPQIGVTVGSVAPALFALLQFPTTWQAILIFAVIQVVAFVGGNLIYPRMQADTQNIDPVATILSLSFWTVLWGIPGAFLAVPMTLMLMMIFAQFENTKWVAAALSNDGKPDFRRSV